MLSFAFKILWPSLPFMDRVGLVFLLCFAIAIVAVVAVARGDAALRIELKDIDYSTTTGFNVAAVVITLILIALYATWW